MEQKSLAIIIPAYKSAFLDQTLKSLADQTNGRFTVYIGDDHSPENIEIICRKYEKVLDIQYHRFSENLGGHSLVKQWNRCVALSSEPWVWLFSDDDLAHPQCVDAFYDSLSNGSISSSVYRFNSWIIDDQNNVVRKNEPHPKIETTIQFASARLRFARKSFVTDHIFRRQRFDAAGGFIDFPTGLASDDASWIAFAGDGSLQTINRGIVQWRLSSINISSFKKTLSAGKIEAMVLYIQWLHQHFYQRNNVSGEQFHALIRDTKYWFSRNTLYLGYHFSRIEQHQFETILSKIWDESLRNIHFRLVVLSVVSDSVTLVRRMLRRQID